MNDLTKILLAVAIAVAGAPSLTGCGNESSRPSGSVATDEHGHEHTGDDHTPHTDEDHHDEVSLGTVRIGEFDVELAQGHGAIASGKELHLVVKLPYTDRGATVVRAWIGTEDRFASVVARGEYAASHDDYDIHAIAPDPLPENTMWWIEIEKPDGEKLVGSIKPL
jgi:hypothetical protein